MIAWLRVVDADDFDVEGGIYFRRIAKALADAFERGEDKETDRG
jgi:hypothetical protein